MSKPEPLVVLRFAQGVSDYVAVGKLIYEGGQPFAELPDAIRETLSSRPQRIRLYEENLRLIEDEPGRAPLYFHGKLLVIPN
jgi:hypothetical protein